MNNARSQNITSRLEELFHSELYSGNVDLLKRGKTKDTYFSCKFSEACGVDPKKHPIWSPAFGSKDTNVMVIGEAPSATEGSGANVGGRFEEWEDNTKSRVVQFRNWVYDEFKSFPYYTDFVKCGLNRQIREDKKVLTSRRSNCFNNFLKHEIEIMDPEYILVLGTLFKDFLDKVIDNRFKPRIKYLMHYSPQARLQLSIKDKRKIIWKLNVGKLTKREIDNMKLTELSYFKEYVNNLPE